MVKFHVPIIRPIFSCQVTFLSKHLLIYMLALCLMLYYAQNYQWEAIQYERAMIPIRINFCNIKSLQLMISKLTLQISSLFSAAAWEIYYYSYACMYSTNNIIILGIQIVEKSTVSTVNIVQYSQHDTWILYKLVTSQHM